MLGALEKLNVNQITIHTYTHKKTEVKFQLWQALQSRGSESWQPVTGDLAWRGGHWRLPWGGHRAEVWRIIAVISQRGTEGKPRQKDQSLQRPGLGRGLWVTQLREVLCCWAWRMRKGLVGGADGEWSGEQTARRPWCDRTRWVDQGCPSLFLWRITYGTLL